MRKLFVITVASVVLVFCGYAGYRAYGVWKTKHFASLAQNFLAKGDARNAFDQVSAQIQKKEKIDGIIGLEATGGSGAAEAVARGR